MTDPQPVPGAPPSSPTAVARLRVLSPGPKAEAVLEAARRFVDVVPLEDGVFELRFHYADPLGAVPVLDVYLRRLKLKDWREHVAIEVAGLHGRAPWR